MADPFVAEIRMFACNFAPRGWATCDGQLLPISQNTALFSLLGTMYGGDGKSTFALPNLEGSGAMHHGQGPGLSEYFSGQTGGSANVTLISSEIPVHTHVLMSKPTGGQADPTGRLFGSAGTQLPPPNMYANAQGTPKTMNTLALSNYGGDFPHNNLMPYQVVTFCIAMQGIFPARN